jgi:hypothetical protein
MEDIMAGYKPRFTVRKQSSGYTLSETYYVWKLGAGRVSVHAGTRECAQSDADDLNIGDLVKPHAEDPRPYAVRRAEAGAAYRAWKAGQPS